MTTRPPYEVADVIRIAGRRFLKRFGKSLTWAQVKVLHAIVRCRTAVLGGHRDQCVRCGHQVISYNSCRNRHCPKCQVNAREKWLLKRRQELLPVEYYHIVFSVPHRLVPLIWQNKKRLFSLLFKTVSATLLEVASDPTYLGAEIGFLTILHTWGQTLQPHPHIHCVVPGGGLSPDHTRWIPTRTHFFLPVKILSRMFRGKFVEGLKRLFSEGKLEFHGECQALADEKAFSAFLRPLFRQDWVVYSKPPFGGPEHVLQYLGRYTHRVAISNHRMVSVDEKNVVFRWKDYAHHSRQRTMTLSCEEFLHRFLQHILPKGFPRIRSYGWLANRCRKGMLPLVRECFDQPVTPPDPKRADTDGPRCPICHGEMRIVERFNSKLPQHGKTRRIPLNDTS